MTFGFDNTAEEVTEGLDLTGQTWLVTGCNSGLGLETARVLALRGAYIIGAARTVEKATQALATLAIDGTPIACELSSLPSVHDAIAAVRSLGRPLTGIIANAGIMALPECTQKDGIELQFYVNHIGHFVLVTGLTDLLTDEGRVVVLSSGAHFYARDSGLELDNISGEREYEAWRMYGRSKLANIHFAVGLNQRFEGTNRRANAVHPGVIDTNLGRHVPDKKAMYEALKKRVRLKTIPQRCGDSMLRCDPPGVAGCWRSILRRLPTGESCSRSMRPELTGCALGEDRSACGLPYEVLSITATWAIDIPNSGCRARLRQVRLKKGHLRRRQAQGY